VGGWRSEIEVEAENTLKACHAASGIVLECARLRRVVNNMGRQSLWQAKFPRFERDALQGRRKVLLQERSE